MRGVVVVDARPLNINSSAGRTIVCLFLSTIILFLLFSQECARAQEGRPQRVAAAGILTDRLSLNELRRWQAIERFVFAKSFSGELLYPTLHNLWRWVGSSSHEIYIELHESKHKRSCTAGSFGIEEFDPEGKRHVAVIRLYLSVIDQAVVGAHTARPDGFIPLAGLSKEERYVEVLGHELAHAVYILSDLERAQKVNDLIEQTNELFLSPVRDREQPLSPWLRERLIQRDHFLEELEAYAEKMEAQIWQELIGNPFPK
jgi:hypothetical protein